MDTSKVWYASQTVWGAIAAIGASLGGAWYAYQNKDMPGITASLTALLGGLLALVGRFKADTQITTSSK